ncbi:type I methionyl aminopeptidase [Candidatus Roizmanbacteria bacterium]|nr:type I methionyl aminopeptidase [Candidatus Roizmanbacteria bacterium]
MIHLKTPEEITIMQEGGKKLRTVVKGLLPKIRSGMTTNFIDIEAERLIRAQGAEPSFKRVPGYHWSTCMPINEQVVHTPPSSRILGEGDLVTLDIGVFYKGYHTDWATTVIIGRPLSNEHLHFLEVGKRALRKAIQNATAGKCIGNMSEAIQQEIYSEGYYILKELTGHGIGRELHEDPYVPGHLDRPVEKTPHIKPGLVLAIEVIYSIGTENMSYEKDNEWSIVTQDGSLAACFEETVAIQQNNSFILT